MCQSGSTGCKLQCIDVDVDVDVDVDIAAIAFRPIELTHSSSLPSTMIFILMLILTYIHILVFMLILYYILYEHVTYHCR